jgi:phosphotransferase system HPr-like phosphotransfer protein
MCIALESAMKEVRLGTDGETSCDIFLVSEPEAQAIQALQDTAYDLQVTCPVSRNTLLY